MKVLFLAASASHILVRRVVGRLRCSLLPFQFACDLPLKVLLVDFPLFEPFEEASVIQKLFHVLVVPVRVLWPNQRQQKREK